VGVSTEAAGRTAVSRVAPTRTFSRISWEGKRQCPAEEPRSKHARKMESMFFITKLCPRDGIACKGLPLRGLLENRT
jgi:hypothetical protein